MATAEEFERVSRLIREAYPTIAYFAESWERLATSSGVCLAFPRPRPTLQYSDRDAAMAAIWRHHA
jgi:hypothetical protein